MARESVTASILLTLAMVVGCNNSPGGAAARGVVSVEEDDAEMIAAIETARNTFEFFEENWKTMENDGYSLKFALPTMDGELEHIWFSPTNIQGDSVTGECANDPEAIPGLKPGDIRTVSRNDVTDWMIVVGNQCFGGYTIRVLANRHPDDAPPLEFMDPPVK